MKPGRDRKERSLRDEDKLVKTEVDAEDLEEPSMADIPRYTYEKWFDGQQRLSAKSRKVR